MDYHSRLKQIGTAISENVVVQHVRRAVRAMAKRWRALCFATRFYRQARQCVPVPVASSPPAEDFSEVLFRRSLAPRLHALVQLRVASRIASIAETQARSQLCRQAGCTDAQIGAVLLGHMNGEFSEPETLALRYADDMTRTPIDIDPLVVRRLGAHFSKAEVLELTASIAHENFRTRFGNAGAQLR